MRFLIAAALCVAVCIPAYAKDITLTLDDAKQQSITAAAAMMSLCIGDLTLYRSTQNCEAVAQALRGMAGFVSAAKVEAAKANNPPETPKP